MVPVSTLFEVRYGVNLELNTLIQCQDGINFVSRTSKNNGVAARVWPVPNLDPIPAGTITVAGGGSVMESFLQPNPYYSGRDLYYLIAREEMADAQKLYYCACLRANKYRFNYGRQANRTLKDILIPALDEIPHWVNETSCDVTVSASAPQNPSVGFELQVCDWKAFLLSDLFLLKKGQRLTKAEMIPGDTPFIGAINHNNGLSNFVGQSASHPGNTLTVNYDGNGVAEAYYQPVPFRCLDSVNVLYPKFIMTPAIGLFIATLIQKEKYRFSYGRKWHLERMQQSMIRLPVTSEGVPDWLWIEQYIHSMPYSSQIESRLALNSSG